MNANEFTLKSIRKAAHLTNRVSAKMSHFSARVEGKTTRLLSGIDMSVKVSKSTPLEKVYYANIPFIKPVMPAMPAVGSKSTITIFLPTLDNGAFFGGIATALVVAAKFALASRRQLRVVQTIKTGQHEDLSKFFLSEGIDVSNLDIAITSVADRQYNIYGYIPMHPDDIFIASAWWDAYIINQLPINKFIYLIQDFEPIFYNNSDLYVLSEKTYRGNKFIPLCNTRLMYDFMRERKYPAFNRTSAYYFEPAVSRIDSGQLHKKSSIDKKRLFLFGRPNVHRNLFFSALNAIDIAIQKGFIDTSNYEFFMAGQDDLPDISLPSGVAVKNLGKMKMADYIDFSKTVDIAVSPMMAPHPNYPTLEFASIGTAVVTTKYANKQSLKEYSENIFMAEVEAESMAEAIKLAAKKSYGRKIDDIKNNNIGSSWNKSLDSVIKKILAEL
ncbi:hypothetical protein FWG95_00395 [Candidatus Saccharibacteria bacterium]|nr:hypothetical protein [Candidatus Saccharibacteria bacterium]